MPEDQYKAGLNFLDYVRHTALYQNSSNIWESVFDSDNFPVHDANLPFYGFQRLHQGHNILGVIYSGSLRIEPEPFGLMSGVVTDMGYLRRDSYKDSLDEVVKVIPLIFFIDKRIQLAGEYVSEFPIQKKIREILFYTAAQGRDVYSHLEEYRKLDEKLLPDPKMHLEELASALLDMLTSTGNRVFELYFHRLARKSYFKNEKAGDEVVRFKDIWNRYQEIKAAQRFGEGSGQLMSQPPPVMAGVSPVYA